MAAKKGKLNFKIILIVLLTIGVAISIYALTTQNMANRSSAGWNLPSLGRNRGATNAPTGSMEDNSGQYKRCVDACKDDEENYCQNFSDNPEDYKQCKAGTLNKGIYTSYKAELTACKKECKKQYK